MSLLKLDNVAYSYENKSKPVFENLSYKFEEGKIYAIVGRSGAGKTTLLSLLSGLAKPTEGEILLENEDISKIDKYKYRSQKVGVIFQSFNLLPNLTAIENIILSIDISKKKRENKRQDAIELLQKVGLSESEGNRRVLKLSGGQQQRIAIARALSYDPHIILADEPTGNLDVETQNEIIKIFEKLAKEEDRCIIIVTHSQDVAKRADNIYQLG